MHTTISFGKVAYSTNRKSNEATIQMELKVKDKEVRNWDTLETMKDQLTFSASGNIWNSKGTDCEACGQIIDEIYLLIPDNKKLQRICEIWDAYHLNDMNAGTKKQTEYLDTLKASGWKYNYTEACDKLKAVNLFEDRGYKYGHGWLFRPIPESILNEIKAIIAE